MAFRTVVKRSFASVPGLGAKSPTPLVQHFQPSWLKSPLFTREEIVVPERTIPDSVLKFELQSTFDHGTAIYYPHLKYNPADFKVGLRVSINDLGLDENEKQVLRIMLGKRYSCGNQMITLKIDRFANRLENKKYATFTLERLVAEAKRLTKEADHYNSQEQPASTA